jgi:hypothetical protein
MHAGIGLFIDVGTRENFIIIILLAGSNMNNHCSHKNPSDNCGGP